MEATGQLATRFATEHPDEVSRRLESLEPAVVARFLEGVTPATAASLIHRMAPAIVAGSVEVMEDGPCIDMLVLVPVQRCVQVLRHVDPQRCGHILSHLPEPLETKVTRILRYPDGSAGAMADTSVDPLPADMTVGDACKISQDPRVPYVYVVGRDHRLAGVVHRRDARAADKQSTLEAIMTTDVIRIPARASVAAVQKHSAWRDLDALPVVDSSGVYVGTIRHKSLRELRESPPLAAGPESPLSTLLDLGELYWVGLDSLVAVLAAKAGDSPAGGVEQ